MWLLYFTKLKNYHTLRIYHIVDPLTLECLMQKKIEHVTMRYQLGDYFGQKTPAAL